MVRDILKEVEASGGGADADKRLTVEKRSIAAIIGSGGTTVRQIQDDTGAKLTIDRVRACVPALFPLFAPRAGDKTGCLCVCPIHAGKTCAMKGLLARLAGPCPPVLSVPCVLVVQCACPVFVFVPVIVCVQCCVYAF